MSNVPYSNPEIYLNGFDLSPYFLRSVGARKVFERVPKEYQVYFSKQINFYLFIGNKPYFFNFSRHEKCFNFSMQIQFGMMFRLYFINSDDDYAQFLIRYQGEILLR